MKLKQTMCKKIFIKIIINLILANILEIHSFMMIQLKEVIGKAKDETKGVPIFEFVSLESKM